MHIRLFSLIPSNIHFTGHYDRSKTFLSRVCSYLYITTYETRSFSSMFYLFHISWYSDTVKAHRSNICDTVTSCSFCKSNGCKLSVHRNVGSMDKKKQKPHPQDILFIHRFLKRNTFYESYLIDCSVFHHTVRNNKYIVSHKLQ